MHRLLSILLLSLISSWASASTILAVQGEPDNGLGFEGQNQFDSAQWYFEVLTFYPDRGEFSIRLHAQGSNPPSSALTLSFKVPKDHPVVGTQYFMLQSPVTMPGASIAVRNASGCFLSEEGSFKVLEVAGQNGALQRLAIDFQTRCPSKTSVLRGQIRINSTLPTQAPALTAAPFAQDYADEGDIVDLDGRWSWAGASTIASYSWRQISGPAVVINNATAARASFTATASAGSLSESEFELTVTDALGAQAVGIRKVRIYSTSKPRTLFALQGDPGEFVVPGRSLLNRDTDSSFIQLVYEAGREVQIETNDPIASDSFRISLRAPEGQALMVGNYENAWRTPAGNQPGIDLNAFSRGCNMATGRFTIREIEFNGPHTALVRLAADFEVGCIDEAPLKAYGQVRINSTIPRLQQRPTASAGTDFTATEGESVTLHAEGSRPGKYPIASFHWTQIAGPAVVLANAETSTPGFVAPPVTSGSTAMTFRLEVTDTAGNQTTDDVRITVLDTREPRSLVYIDSPRGELLGQGIRTTFDENDGVFITGTPAEHQASWYSVAFQGANLQLLSIDLQAPDGQQLAVGNYEAVERIIGKSPLRAGMDIDLNSLGCNRLRGRFVIREIAFEPTTQAIQRFAGDFFQYCENATVPLFVAFRFHSAVPLLLQEPTAAAGASQQVLERSTTTLDAGNSMNGDGGVINRWQWRQISGPSVTLQNAASKTATFPTPKVATGATQKLVFELETFSSNGTSDTDTTEITVRSKSIPRSFAHLESEPGDYIGLAGTYDLTEAAGSFLARKLEGSVFVAAVTWVGLGNDWHFDVQGDSPQSIPRGSFSIDSRVTQNTPWLEVSGNGRGCNNVKSEFQILDVDTGSGLNSLAADFTQRCDSGTGVLKGQLRFNTVFPDSNAGADRDANAGNRVELSAAESVATVGSIRSYRWRQLSGPSVTLSSATAAVASFQAPSVTTVSPLEFALDVTDDRGITDTDTVVIRVQPTAATGGGSGESTPPPAQSSGKGGGGGSFDETLLMLLSLMAMRAKIAIRRRIA